MKRTATLLVLGIIISILADGVFAKETPVTPQQTNAVTYEYAWFYDPDYTDPTGTYSDVNTELQRLRSIFPANTFSATWYVGLHQFAWGYRPFDNGAIIFSNLQ